jgi:hypothetical protein
LCKAWDGIVGCELLKVLEENVRVLLQMLSEEVQKHLCHLRNVVVMLGLRGTAIIVLNSGIAQ